MAREDYRALVRRVAAQFKDPRRQRERSLIWLFERLALGRVPREIAESELIAGREENHEFLVAHNIKRDADLLGLKLPPGYPKGRKMKSSGRVMTR